MVTEDDGGEKMLDGERTDIQELGYKHIVHRLEDVEIGHLINDGNELFEELQLHIGHHEVQSLGLALGAHRDDLPKSLHTLLTVGSSVVYVGLHRVIGVQNHLLRYESPRDSSRTAEIRMEDTRPQTPVLFICSRVNAARLVHLVEIHLRGLGSERLLHLLVVLVVSLLHDAVENRQPLAGVPHGQIHAATVIGLIGEKSVEDVTRAGAPVREEVWSVRENDIGEELRMIR